jgi:hypothetical protein
VSCPECGLDYESLTAADAVVAIRGLPRRYRAPLTRLLPGEDDSVLRTRPAPDVWSPLEYAAHVREMLDVYETRIRRALTEDRPELDPIEPHEAAERGRYDEHDPVGVADGIAAVAEVLATTLESVPAEGWDRVGLSHGKERSVLYTARRAVHEGGHHLLDIGRGLRAVRSGDRAAGGR